MNKSELRKLLSYRRESLSSTEFEQRNSAMIEKLIEVLKQKTFEYIHIFLSIPQKNEPQTQPIIDWLIEYKPEAKIVVSKSDFQHKRMLNYEYTGPHQLLANKLGIPEPIEGEIIDPKLLDIVLVPMLGFDTDGHRLGYGQGFYDRFLANDCKVNALKIGLSILPPIDNFQLAEAHDVPLDMCITPFGVFEFQ
ncbi:5-formyltetrahydrofolate cyclo-ligase [Fulvivirgaceae bacterium LMO-SS25]